MYTGKLSKLDLLIIVGWLLVGWGMVSFFNAYLAFLSPLVLLALTGLLIMIVAEFFFG